jgi:hypothetical protein
MPSPSNQRESATGRPKTPFVSAHKYAMLTILLLMLSIVVTLLAMVSQITHLALETDEYGLHRYYVAVGVQMLLFGATAVAFCVWVHRVYRNLSVIQLTTPKLTASKAIEGFLIPIINFYHPLDVMTQLWSGSSHSGRERSPIVLLWWLSFLASWLVTLIAAILSVLKVWGPVQETAWSVVSQVFWLGSSVMAVVMVRAIDVMQRERVEMVADLQSGPAVPINAQARDHKQPAIH